MAVSYHAEEPVGFITLDNPPANSYDRAFMEELGGAIVQAADDEAADVVIVRSSSPKFFSAGADVKAFAEQDPEQSAEMIEVAHQALGRIAAIPKVFIALIQGHALGGGLPALRGPGLVQARHAGGHARPPARQRRHAAAAPHGGRQHRP